MQLLDDAVVYLPFDPQVKSVRPFVLKHSKKMSPSFPSYKNKTKFMSTMSIDEYGSGPRILFDQTIFPCLG